MWKGFYDKIFIMKEYLYFDKIEWRESGNVFIVKSDLNNKYSVIINGFVYTYYLIQDTYALSYNDKYISEDDIENALQKYNFCYTDESEYLDWFKTTSCDIISDKTLYHFRIICDDYEVNFISDEIPRVSCERIN